MNRTLLWIKKNWVLLLVNTLLLLPLVNLAVSLQYDFSGRGPLIGYPLPEQLKAFLIKAGKPVTPLWFPVHSTGEWAIRLMVCCLTCTPLAILFGWKTSRYRKWFGILTFFYTAVHAVLFCADRGILSIFGEFNYILGAMATLIIIPLGITSNRWSMSRLKQTWTKLQRWAYAAGVLSLMHIVFLPGGSWKFYATVLGAGFLLRIPALRQILVNKRRNPEPTSRTRLFPLTGAGNPDV